MPLKQCLLSCSHCVALYTSLLEERNSFIRCPFTSCNRRVMVVIEGGCGDGWGDGGREMRGYRKLWGGMGNEG